MNTLTSSGPVESEVLIRRPWKWWRSLWVRCLGVFVLIWIITGVFLWSYCRSAWAVFRVNGLAEPSQDSVLIQFRRYAGLPSYLSRFLIADRDVETVLLLSTGVDDQWLVRLRRFQKLTNVSLDGGQIGPGAAEFVGPP